MAGSYTFRNITTYVVEPEGEPVQSLPSKNSLDFSPQNACLEEAPDDGNPYVRQSKSWQGLDLTKENIEGLTESDSPEFADVVIPDLNSVTNGGSVPDVDYNWFKGLYATLVDGSVKSFIKGLLSVVNGLATRVGVLENNIIASYTFTQDVLTTFTLTGFEILPNRPFKVIIKFPQVSDVDTIYTFYVRFNDISSSNYLTTNTLSSVFTSSAGQLYTYVEFNFTLSNGDLDGFATVRTRRTGAIGSSFPMSNIFGCNIQSITSLSILLYTLPKIPAGSTILIYKA